MDKGSGYYGIYVWGEVQIYLDYFCKRYNQGKKTAGVDGVIAVSPEQRLNLTEEIKGTLKAKPLRRVWIPKPGRDEKRPLGIPTIKDRARQALIKSALEPEWESKMERTSYGFRPGRSAQDAISRIFSTINRALAN